MCCIESEAFLGCDFAAHEMFRENNDSRELAVHLSSVVNALSKDNYRGFYSDKYAFDEQYPHLVTIFNPRSQYRLNGIT